MNINKINNRELRVYAYKVYTEGLVYNDIVYRDDNWIIMLALSRDTVDITVTVQYKNKGTATDKIVAERKLTAQNGSKKYYHVDVRSLHGYLTPTVEITSKLRKIISIIDSESKRFTGKGII